MDFEHIVIVNDPRSPDVPLIPRQEVADALALLVLRPQIFDEGLDGAEIDFLAPGQVRRETRRGQIIVRERLLFSAMGAGFEQIVEAPEALAGASKLVSLEEPAPGVLLLRFRYKSAATADAPDISADERAALQSAYLGADRDFVSTVRELHEHGALETLIALHAPPGMAL